MRRNIHQYLVIIYVLTIEICLRIHTFVQYSLFCKKHAWPAQEFMPFWRELLFQLSTVPYLQGVAAIFFCWHGSDINFCEEMHRFYLSKQCLRTPLSGCVALAIHILSSVGLYRGDSFHFHFKKFEENLGNADNTQMCIGVCLKGGRLSVAMFWEKRGVWEIKRKC